MRKASLAALLVGAALAALPASALAASDTFCVPNPGPGCTNHNAIDLPTALSDASLDSNDATVKIAAGTYTCPSGGYAVDNAGGALVTVRGAGIGQTTLTCLSNFDISSSEVGVIRADGGITISNLSIHVPSGAGQFGDGHNGMWLAGGATADHVSIDSDAGATSPTGVYLDPGTIRNSTIAMPMTLNDSAAWGFAGSTIDRVTASAGGGVIFGQDLTIERSTITGPWDVDTQDGSIRVYDSLLDVTPGGPLGGLYGLIAEQFNNAPSNPSIVARNVTIVGGGTGSVGTAAVANYTGQVASITLADSVISGPATAISRSATLGQADILASHDDYRVGSYAGSGSGSTTESHSLHASPGFVNPAMGAFDLAPGSTLIDAGTPGPLAAGEPGTDLTGVPRILAGRGTCTAGRDIGAYEFAPSHLPASAHALSATSSTGQRVRFTATGCSVDPRLTASFSWSFGDGSHGSGVHVGHVFRAPGVHHVTLTVSDAVGRHGQATATVTVYLTPAISKLKLVLKPAGKASISYRDSVAAQTTLTLKHAHGAAVSSRHHSDHRGPNTASLSTKGLSPGHYVLVAVARNAAGARSRPARVGFTIS